VIENKENRRTNQVTLKVLAKHLGLAPGTVSKVLNNATGSEVISQLTKTRILAAARKLQYQPNFVAQSLRTRRTYLIGVLVRDIGDPDDALLIAGIERVLRPRGYLFITGVHHNNSEMLESYAGLFLRRGVEGLITVDADFPYSSPLPTVAIAIPRNWTVENPSALAADLGPSHGSSMQSRQFLERVGKSATETLLAQIEHHGEDLLDLRSSPEWTAHDCGYTMPAVPNG
jgi:DNA-binding LacI/PurR family transcriptional regulator